MQKLIRRSVEYAMEHRGRSAVYAPAIWRAIWTSRSPKFVGIWVNELTLDMGDPRPRRCAAGCCNSDTSAGLIPNVGEIDFV